jgi:hypothetical protein
MKCIQLAQDVSMAGFSDEFHLFKFKTRGNAFFHEHRLFSNCQEFVQE